MAAPVIAVVDAGITGLAAALALRAAGIDIIVFEQATAFKRIGAAINLTPNAVKVLDGLGIGNDLRRSAHVPAYRISRNWDTGEITSKVELGTAALERYGVTPLLLHRADLLTALESAVPPGAIRFGKKLQHLEPQGDKVRLEFEDGTQLYADGVIGADGIHSITRRELFGPETPLFTGMSAYRSLIARDRITGQDFDSFVKWWGPVPECQLVTFLINRGRELFIFATMPETEHTRESWSAAGEIEMLRTYFAGFHADARAVLDACDSTLRTALNERPPLEHWSSGNATLIGDACHAMMPFMAQGAAMGLEDAAVLSRCVQADKEWGTALARYERVRKERAHKIQLGSHQNQWLRQGAISADNPFNDPDWVYGYDAWTTDLL
ncbi:MAG: FAD-dependent monooxygenase [Proteobacteria bacterium]|nr:FAD-dependent monooxygenase [Pseudomonadota bacterium]